MSKKKPVMSVDVHETWFGLVDVVEINGVLYEAIEEKNMEYLKELKEECAREQGNK